MNRCKLGDIFHIKQGFAFKTENYVDISNYRLITLGNFTSNNEFKYNDEKATYYGGEFPEDVVLQKGDLIIPLTEQTEGLFGNSAFIPEPNGNYTFVLNQRVGKILLLNKYTDKTYLHYLLATNNVRKQIEARASGTQQRNVSPENIYDVVVDVIDIEDQQKVGKLLFDIEKKRNLNNKINSELEAMAKELYEYWFVQFDFPDENGKPYKSSGGKMVWNEELKREIPEGWEVKTLGDIIVENKKSPFKVSDANGSGEYPFFTSGTDILLHDEALVDGLNCYLNTGGNGDVKVYNGKSAYSGDTWCIKGKNNSTAYLSQILLSFRPRLDIKFFAGTGLQHLQKDLLKMENIVMPHKNILNKFNEDIETITLKIANNKKQNKDLAELRDFLLPMLMNGQVTVK